MSGANPAPVSPVQQPRANATGPMQNSKLRLMGGVAAIVGGLAGIVFFTSGPPREPGREFKPAEGAPGQIGEDFKPWAPPQPQRTAAATPLPEPSKVAPFVVGSASYRPAPLMAFGDARGGQAGGAVGARAGGDDLEGRHGTQASPAAGGDALAGRLQAEDQATAVATRLPDRNLFLTEGTPIACIPDAPITSDVEGAFRCKVPEAVYSTSGAVALLDPGTWIVGRVGAGLRRGQRRLFAVMTRMETPQGCLVRIRAPAADALGQAGLEGEIDTKFFQRFGAYIGMAFLDAGMQAAVLAASNIGSGGGIRFNQFQSAGRQGGQSLFADDAAIPPTLYRNQAEPIVVRLTQDVDMRPCFRLRVR